jgi:cell division protein FtsW
LIENRELHSKIEWGLILGAFLLVSLGLIAIYAASAMKGLQSYNDPFFFVRKQAFVAFAGFAVVLMFRKLDPKFIERAPLPLVVLGLVLLSFILVPGAYTKVGGAARWLSLPFFRIQPAEIAKLSVVLFLAKSLTRESSRVDNIKTSVIPNILVVGLFAAFLMLQPDFGSTVLIVSIMFMMLIVAGLSKFLTLCSIFSVIALGAAAVLAAPYRMKRILAFLDPWSQIKQGGFQIIQSYLAFQNGGLLGTGLGESRQKLYFLPEAHTDFILSVIGEELGLLGVVLVISLFGYVSWLGFKIARMQTNQFFKHTAFGLSLMIALQSLFNICVVMGLLPTKGITLPFVSNGSSSLFTFLLAIGLLVAINRGAVRQT